MTDYLRKKSDGSGFEKDWWNGKYKTKDIGIDGAEEIVGRNITGAGMAGMATNVAEIASGLLDRGKDPDRPSSAAAQGLGLAAKGAQMGMALGPWGALAGGIIGGAAGVWKASEEQEEYLTQKDRERAAEDEEDYLQGRGYTRAMKANAYEKYA